MIYKEIKRTWSHNDLNYIPRLREVFPELNKLSTEELCDRFIDLDLNFYTENKKKVNPLLRLTLPFALVTMFVMFLSLPFVFLFTGTWGYSPNKLLNWFRALRLV